MPPAEPRPVRELVHVVHPHLPFAGAALPQLVEAVGPLFQVDAKPAHGTSRPLGLGRSERAVRVPHDLPINPRHRDMEVKGQL